MPVRPGAAAQTRLASSTPAASARSRAVYGDDAARLGGRILGDGAVVACEPPFAVAALAHALDLRRAGVHFAFSAHLPDVRTQLIRERSRELCATYATWDEVRLVLEQFAATVADRRPVLSDPVRGALGEIARLADSIVVRSWTEFGRLVDAAGSVRRDVDIVVNPDPDVPASVDDERTDVVVYAPRWRADELAPFKTALGDLQVPVTIVALDRPTIAGRVRYEPPERAAIALGRARVIVDAEADDPGVALALARLGRPLVVSAAGGASEILQGVYPYDLWDRRRILAATVNALAGAPPEIRAGRYDEFARTCTHAGAPADAPLVSVVVATYNRPELLAASLASIERQTYPSLEIIVVNDGGSDVRDVVGRFPRARLIEQPSNGGPAAARNRGLAEARGTLAIVFDDDDEMFPDHLATLARALASSGLDVAYGQMMNCLVDGAGETFVGHTAILDHTDIQWAGALAPTAILFRRALIDEIGGFDESLGTAEDYEFWLRLAKGREWARVSDVTSLYFIRADGSNYSARAGVPRHLSAHRAIYAKHPADRPLVRAGRTSMLQYFGGNATAGQIDQR